MKSDQSSALIITITATLFFLPDTVCQQRKNILMISKWHNTLTIITVYNVLKLPVADDLRPSLGVYAESNPALLNTDVAVTPNIDSLASASALFECAYSQSPFCGPSRAALLTGRRPDTNGVYDLNHGFRETSGNPDMIPLPEHFKNNGYRTFSIGKVYHDNSIAEDPQSWTDEPMEGSDFYR